MKNKYIFLFFIEIVLLNLLLWSDQFIYYNITLINRPVACVKTSATGKCIYMRKI